MIKDGAFSLREFLAVDARQFEAFFREPLTDIHSQLQLKQPWLSEAELRYVCHVLLTYYRVPINMYTVADLIDRYQRGDLNLQGKAVAAETTLLMIGFFGQIDREFWRRRRSFPTTYYTAAAQHLYWEVGRESGKVVYDNVGHNLRSWMFALASLSEYFENNRLSSFLIS